VGQLRMKGKTYHVAGFDADVYGFLRDLARYLRYAEPRTGRLLAYRSDFRHIVRHPSPIGLVYSLSSDDYLQRRLAVWLLGRVKWSRGITFL